MQIEDGYTALSQYTQYSDYSDLEIYEVGEDRSLPEITQITMRGDTNSQYITYQIPRYADGVDLTTKTIIARWYNKDNYEDGGSYSDICDARYNDEYIRFAWLLEYGVTEIAGVVGYCFETVGSNEVDASYIWKTALGKLTITDNLDNGAAGTEPDEDWFTTLMANVDTLYKAAEAAEEQTALCKTATEECEAATTAANTATSNANTATSNANTATTNANTATSNANTATTAATEAAESANTAAAAVYTDRNFLLLLNDDRTLTLTYNDEE